MPCQDHGYEDAERNERRARCDMLARIACKAMDELEKQGTSEFLLIRDEEVRTWWEQHKKAEIESQERKK